MARIRSIKPELRRSKTVARWPREVRYAWVLLWGYLDDYGKGVDDPRLIASDLFPLAEDADVTPGKMEKWLAMMASQPVDPEQPPVICRYEVRGEKYLHAVKWEAHQRISHPTRSAIPWCPSHFPPEALPNNSGAAAGNGGFV